MLAINKRYPKEFSTPVGSSGVGRAHILREGKLPHIRISEIVVQGPVAEPVGGAEEIAVFGKDGFQTDRALDQLLAFAAKAYRRPLQDADRESIRAMYEKRIAEKASPRQAALDVVKLILCSPSFLYLSEVTKEADRRLQPYDLATRLAFAL